jgi:riboflavin kinase
MIMPEELQCLKTIAVMGGLKGQVFLSSQSLGGALGMSPQTAARRLRSLEQKILLTRSVTPDGQYVTITRDGEEALRREYADYCRVFEKEGGGFSLRGSVISGLGEGRYYMSLGPYVRQFVQVLGFEPFPGTLNLRIEPSGIAARKRLDQLEWIAIEGFVAEGRTFGAARCLPCRIRATPCGIIIPGRSHYPDDVLEIIAPVSLRDTYDLADGDEVKIEVTP